MSAFATDEDDPPVRGASVSLESTRVEVPSGLPVSAGFEFPIVSSVSVALVVSVTLVDSVVVSTIPSVVGPTHPTTVVSLEGIHLTPVPPVIRVSEAVGPSRPVGRSESRDYFFG